MELSPRVDVVGVGLNATDTLLQVDTFPLAGEKIPYWNEQVQPGGQVASAMVACQTWGLRTRYVGKFGEDEAARLHAREFQRLGVEACLVHVAQGASPKSLIFVDRRGERTVLNRRDERLTLQPEELRREWIIKARALLVDGHDTAAAIQAATWARDAGLPVVADVDEVYPNLERLLPLVDHLIVSRSLPQRLTGIVHLQEALRVMHTRFGCELTAATLGEEGVLAWDGEDLWQRPAYRVNVVDTTGAGDVFHAGYLYGLLQGWPLPQRLDFACAAAAMNCTAQGARGGIGTLEAVQALLAGGVPPATPRPSDT